MIVRPIPVRFAAPAVLGLAFIVGAVAWQPASRVVAQQSAVSSDFAEISAAPISKSKERLREGTELIDVSGSFKLTGDRATFYPDGSSARFNGLENLTLERVATVISEDPTPLNWLVTGTITEFKGNNYILVTRAILKSKASSLGQPSARSR